MWLAHWLGRAKHSSGLGPGRGAFTKFSLLWHIAQLLAFAVVLTIISCSFSKSQSDDDLMGSDDESDQALLDASDPAAPEASEPTDIRKLEHPRKANAWETRKLVLGHTDIDVSEVQNCEDNVTGISKEAINQDELLHFQEDVQRMAQLKPAIWHWCFYRIMTAVDQRLERDDTLDADAKNRFFFDQMKSLWIMSRALDRVAGSQRYFTYLRARYMQISRDYFGRSLDVVSDPLGAKRNQPKKPPAKPAGEFSDSDYDY